MKTITVKFDDVFTDVCRSSEYIGAKFGVYDKVRVTEYDNEQMLQWFADAMANVGVILDRLLARKVTTSFITGEATMTLNMQNNNMEQIKDCITRLATAHMLALWLEITATELVQTAKLEEQQLSQQLMRLAYYREMPRYNETIMAEIIITIIHLALTAALIVLLALAYRENNTLRSSLAKAGITLVELQHKVNFYKGECEELEREISKLENRYEKN